MSRSTFLSAALLAAALTVPATAQLQVFGGDAPRMASTRIFWNNGPVGMVCVQYSQPDWKDDYDAMLPQLKGKQVRLGKDFWTTLSTSNTLAIGDAKVPAGSYYLGLKCDDEGNFHLLVIDAVKANKKGWVPFVADAWKADFVCAMKMGKAKESAAKMLISLGGDEKEPTNLTLSIAWGGHQLSVPVKVTLGTETAEAGAKKSGEEEEEEAGEEHEERAAPPVKRIRR